MKTLEYMKPYTRMQIISFKTKVFHVKFTLLRRRQSAVDVHLCSHWKHGISCKITISDIVE